MGRGDINNNVKLGHTGNRIKLSDLSAGVKKANLNEASKTIFEKYDKNNNKILEKDELARLQQDLVPYTDHGKITRGEARRFLKKQGLKGQVNSKEVFNMLNSMGIASEKIADVVEANGKMNIRYKDGDQEIIDLSDGSVKENIANDDDGNTVVTQKTENGREVTTTSPTGETVVQIFDEENNLIQRKTKVDGFDVVENFENGELKSKTKTNGTESFEEQYESGNLTQTIHKKGTVTEYIQDEKVVKKETEIAPGQTNVEEFEYNGDKKSKSTLTQFDGTVIESEFDENENLTKRTETNADKTRSVTTNIKDGKNMSQSVTTGGQTYNVEYDGNGNTKGVIVQNGESPTAVAKKFGCNVQDLLAANSDLVKGKAPKQYFLVGAKIVIPGEISADKFAQMNAGRKTSEQSIEGYKQFMAEQEAKRQAAEAAARAAAGQTQSPQTGAASSAEDAARIKRNAELTKQGKDIAEKLFKDMDGLGTSRNFESHLDEITSENAAQVILGYRQISKDESLCESILDEVGINRQKRNLYINKIFNKLTEQARNAGFDESAIKHYKDRYNLLITNSVSHTDADLDEVLEGLASGITSAQTLTRAEREQASSQSPAEIKWKTVTSLTNTLENSKSSFDNQLQRDGWAADLADGASALWLSKNRATHVREDLAKYETQLNKLKEAPAEQFEAKFKEVFGINYNPQMVAAYEKRKDQMVQVSAMHGYEQSFNNGMSVLLKNANIMEETEARMDNMGHMSNVVVTATKEQVYQREMDKLAQYIGQGKKDVGMQYLNQAFKNAGLNPQTATIEQKWEVMHNVAQQTSNSIHNSVMQLTENKGYDAFKVEAERMYAAAFGTGNDIAQRVEEYNISQQTGEAAVKGVAKAGAAIAIGICTGGAGLVAAAGATAAASAAIDLSDELTRGVGQSGDVAEAFSHIGSNIKEMSADEVGTILKNATIDGATVFAGGQLTKSLMNAKTFVKIGGQMLGDVATGAAAEYGQTGEITIQGVAFQAVFSGAGNLVALKQIKNGVVPHNAATHSSSPDMHPLNGRDPIADGVVARRADQSYLNAKERAMVESGLADTPTPQEVEAFRQSLGEAPTPEQRAAIDAHNQRVAEANAKAHQIEENIPDDVAARLRGESSSPAAAKPDVDPQIKALTDEINGLDGSIKRLEAQINGAKKFGKNTQKLEDQLQKLQQQRNVKSAELETAKKSVEVTPDNVSSTNKNNQFIPVESDKQALDIYQTEVEQKTAYHLDDERLTEVAKKGESYFLEPGGGFRYEIQNSTGDFHVDLEKYNKRLTNAIKWKMHIYADSPQEWANVAKVARSYLKENDIMYKTMQSLSDEEFNIMRTTNNGTQKGKAFTIYFDSEEQFLQTAKALETRFKESGLKSSGTVTNEAQIGDSGFLSYRHEDAVRGDVYKPDDIEDPYLRGSKPSSARPKNSSADGAHVESANTNSAPVDNSGYVFLTPEQRMAMGQIGSNVNSAKSLDDLVKVQAWLDKMPECPQKSHLQRQIDAKKASLSPAQKSP